MLDIHPLHKHFHGIGEFLLHLVAITIGLLIAVQIESFVEWRHHVHIAAEAREALHKEIASNLKALRDAQPALKQWTAQVNDGLADMQRVVDHPTDPAAQPHRLGIGCSGFTLENTAWKTAQSTGALDYMPYEEAATYVNIYQAQEQFRQTQDPPCVDAAEIYGIVSEYHLDPKTTKVTKEEAEDMAEKFGEMQFHLGFTSAILDENIELNAAFVEGRKPRTNFTADFQ